MEQQHWQPTTRDDYEEIVNRDVYTHDGEWIGRVESIIHPEEGELEQAHLGHFIVVRPDFEDGPLGDEAVYVPETNVVQATPDAVELNVDVRDLPKQDWARLPVDLDQQSTPLPEDVPPVPPGNWYEISNRTAE